MEPFNIYDLAPVPNVCNQILREVISLEKVSIAHVMMLPGDESLLHKHDVMHEIYLIMDGEGKLRIGASGLNVKQDACILIKPGIQHKLVNSGANYLTHLVFAVPPFQASDVTVIKEKRKSDVLHKNFLFDGNQVMASDGALVYELLSKDERKQLDVALALGFLPPGRKAKPHRHQISDEVYIVANGYGKVHLAKESFLVQRGAVIHIPAGIVHSLENINHKRVLEVVCLSSPAYAESDFIIK